MTDEGFERAVRCHADRIQCHAVWLLHDREEARDITQETFVRLWERRHDVAEPAARGWLLKTVHRMCLDRHRRLAVRAVSDQNPEDLPAFDRPGGNPESAAATAGLGAILERALVTLAPRDRAAVLLREVEGLSYGEVGQALGLPVGTVKSSVHRSRERLREQLGREGVKR